MRAIGRSNRILGAIGLSVCFSTVWAQTPSEQNRADAAIAEQKADGDVVQAIADADKLAATSRPKAVERLKQAQQNLDLSILLGSQKREELTKRLQGKIAGLEGRATITLPVEDAAKAKASAKAAIEKAKVENDEVTKGLRKAEELLTANRKSEAAQEIAKLAVKYPNNPAVMGVNRATLTANNLQSWNEIQKGFAAAWVLNEQQMLRSATPIPQDRVFPDKKEWDRITELRRKEMTIKLSEREEAILKSLNTVVTVYVKDRPFQEALQEFSNQIKQEITIDTKSLEDAGLDLNRKMTFTGNVSARTALRALLQPQGLTYVVKDEIIQVVTLDKAEREMLTTRSYVVSDLVDVGGPFSNAVQWGPVASYQQMMQNADAIVNLIKDSIDPKCWKDKGGFCTITFHLPTKSIVVRASTEVHASLGGAFYGKK
jgi:hypothetical protein